LNLLQKGEGKAADDGCFSFPLLTMIIILVFGDFIAWKSLTANKGGLKTTIIANETTLFANKPQ